MPFNSGYAGFCGQIFLQCLVAFITNPQLKITNHSYLCTHYDSRAIKRYERPHPGFEEVSLTSLTEKRK